MICLVCLINRAFCVYMSIILREAPNKGRDLLGEKYGCFIYRAVGAAIS